MDKQLWNTALFLLLIGSFLINSGCGGVRGATTQPGTAAVPAPGTASSNNSPAVQHSVTLTWQGSTSSVSSYNVYRSETGGGPYAKLNSVVDPNNTFVDSSVRSGQTYYYAVTVVDSAGLESGYSNQVTAVVPTP